MVGSICLVGIFGELLLVGVLDLVLASTLDLVENLNAWVDFSNIDHFSNAYRSTDHSISWYIPTLQIWY